MCVLILRVSYGTLFLCPEKCRSKPGRLEKCFSATTCAERLYTGTNRDDRYDGCDNYFHIYVVHNKKSIIFVETLKHKNMPNWCNNKITIMGTEKNLKPILEKLNAEGTLKNTMETLIGCPDKPTNYEEGGWYDYNINRFGTKWDFKPTEMFLDVELIDIDCDTAWGPPMGFIETLSEMYNVKVTICYFEPGMDFAGQSIFENGELLESTDVEYQEGLYLYSEWFWEEVEMYVESAIEEGQSYEDFKEGYNFLKEEEFVTLKTTFDRGIAVYNQILEDEK